jgi:DNA-binding Lrp family transcriptional regulator
MLLEVGRYPKSIAHQTAKRFGISRPAVSKRLKKLIAEGHLRATGRTRDRSYQAITTPTVSAVLPVPGLREDDVWRNLASHKLSDLKPNVRAICLHGFTEMLNNVIDHSGSPDVLVEIHESIGFVDININDTGVGIFKKIRSAFNLDDEREAILELSKGKLTTDPEHHSGEGIFFTSRMFDHFGILSGDLYLGHAAGEDDWLLEAHPGMDPITVPGTVVRMRITRSSTRTTQQIFDQFTDSETMAFSKTHVPLVLAKYGDDNLVSRSQAKRVLARFNRFSEVFLDFNGVETIGQAFADEIFRVYRKQHPEISLLVMGANSQVDAMIKRVYANQTDEDPRQRHLELRPG